MRRIGLAVALTISLFLAPRATEAQLQAGKTALIGYLSLRSEPSFLDEAFRQGLRDLGYAEGQNIVIEYRWSDWSPSRVAAFAAELVGLKVDVIVSIGGSVPALAAKKATKTIPIVFLASDPVKAGVVSSLDRPGGNLTGVNILTVELNAKRLELLKDAVSGVTRVAVLANPSNPATRRALKDLEEAAMAKEQAKALLVVSDPMFFAQRERIVDLAAKNRLPGIFEWREFAEAGGLLSYGTNITAMHRRLATYVDRILKGAKPADLPVEQPTKFELVINLKTAKALGLKIPQSLLVRADQVIQ